MATRGSFAQIAKATPVDLDNVPFDIQAVKTMAHSVTRPEVVNRDPAAKRLDLGKPFVGKEDFIQGATFGDLKYQPLRQLGPMGNGPHKLVPCRPVRQSIWRYVAAEDRAAIILESIEHQVEDSEVQGRNTGASFEATDEISARETGAVPHHYPRETFAIELARCLAEQINNGLRGESDSNLHPPAAKTAVAGVAGYIRQHCIHS